MSIIIHENIRYAVLHNRKTAGTALNHVIEQQRLRTPTMNVVCFGHAMTLPRFLKEYSGIKAIFFVREPLSRFMSGFYSRLRQGKPRYYYPWTSKEAKAFATFSTPNSLGEALSDENKHKREAAIAAMQSIRHVRHTYIDFLGPISFLEVHKECIAFIGQQIEFDLDLVRLRSLLKIEDDIQAPNDDMIAHRNPDYLDKNLSHVAIQNLQDWYRDDIEIYKWCLRVRNHLLNPDKDSTA